MTVYKIFTLNTVFKSKYFRQIYKYLPKSKSEEF